MQVCMYAWIAFTQCVRAFNMQDNCRVRLPVIARTRATIVRRLIVLGALSRANRVGQASQCFLCGRHRPMGSRRRRRRCCHV